MAEFVHQLPYLVRIKVQEVTERVPVPAPQPGLSLGLLRPAGTVEEHLAEDGRQEAPFADTERHW